MRLSLFCDGKTVVFEVPDDEGTVFISLCKETLVSEGHERGVIEDMTNDEVLKKAIGSMDYNNWHKQDRHSIHGEIRDSDSVVESAEEMMFRSIEEAEVRKLIHSNLPDSQAHVYYMHVIDGLKFSTIARLIGDKEDNVRKRFNRAERQMKKLQKSFKTPSDF